MNPDLESLAWQLWRPDGTLLSEERAVARLGELLSDSAAPLAAPRAADRLRGGGVVEETKDDSPPEEMTASLLDSIRTKLCEALCDPIGKSLKPEYQRILDHELAAPTVAFLAGHIISLLGAAVILPEVAVLAAFLLLKKGLRDLCDER